MKKAGRTGRAAVVLLAAALAGPGCSAVEHASATEWGVVLGGLAGAGIGRAVGHHNGEEARGGWIGAGAGALVGGLIGALSERDRGPRHTTDPVDLNLRPARTASTAAPWQEDLPPVPPPTRTVRRTTTTTTVVRRTEPVVVEERWIRVER